MSASDCGRECHESYVGIGILAITISIEDLWRCGHSTPIAEAEAVETVVPEAFEVVSGPQPIGTSDSKYNFWVVRHKATKSEFIFVERSARMFLEPLPQSGENTSADLGPRRCCYE